ncbi:MAG: hypothetical protein ACYDCN_12930 [Bacteroidia bacterium]
MDFLAYLLSFINHNGLWMGIVLIVLASGLLVPILFIDGLAAGLIEFFIGFTVGMVILFMGVGKNRSANKIINRHGEKGTAMIVSINPTNMSISDGSDLYYTPVYRYKVLLRTAKNKTIETSFLDFKAPIIVNPPRGIPPAVDLSVYEQLPAVNVEFPVKYLKRHPRMFVIPIDISSQQVQAQLCNPIKKKLMEAKAKLDFDPINPKYRKEVADLMEEYFLRNGCEAINDSTNIDVIRTEIMRLRAGQ